MPRIYMLCGYHGTKSSRIGNVQILFAFFNFNFKHEMKHKQVDVSERNTGNRICKELINGQRWQVYNVYVHVDRLVRENM